MQKITVTLLFILVAVTATRAQQVVYSQTFENTSSLFQDYVLANLDKADPTGTESDTPVSYTHLDVYKRQTFSIPFHSPLISCPDMDIANIKKTATEVIFFIPVLN